MDDEELPPGWAWATLGDICELNPSTATDQIADSDEVAFVPMAAVAELSNQVDLSRRRKMNEVSKGFTRFAPSDIIFAKITPCMENGKIAVVPPVPYGVAYGSTEFHVLRPHTGADASYIRHFVIQQSFRDLARCHMSGAVGQQRVPVAFLREAAIPVAPAREQTRIAIAVNGLFAELDEAEAALARAREGVEQFRASLLHAACTGQLTAVWREANPQAETGADLLRRILAERRAAWERTERARLEAKGTPPRGDAWKARYEEPAALDATDLPKLPAEWTWVTIDHLIRESPRNGISVQGSPQPPGIAALRLDALGEDSLRFECRRYINISDKKASALYITEGDFLVSRANGSPSFLARACVAGKPPADFVFPDTMIRFRFHDFVNHTWVSHVWRSDIVRRQILEKSKTSAGILKISQDDLLAVKLPMPPVKEQDAAVTQIAELLALAGNFSNLSGDNSGTELRQSILHAAFTGRLVPQDPADEPATALLARLRATPATPRRARRTLPKAAE